VLVQDFCPNPKSSKSVVRNVGRGYIDTLPMIEADPLLSMRWPSQRLAETHAPPLGYVTKALVDKEEFVRVQADTRARAPRDILLTLAIVLGTLIFTAAHSIRPSLPSAMITALGIAMWYGASMMIMASAG
jgi:hypothetical protein